MPAKSIDVNDNLPLKFAYPSLMERWWKPGRNAQQTELLRLFTALPEHLKKKATEKVVVGGSIPGSRIRNMHKVSMRESARAR